MKNQFTTVVLGVVVLYVVITSIISIRYGKSAKNVGAFMTAARAVPIWVIGILMASEIIGTPSTVGTAQQAFNSGMAVAWNIVTNLFAFILFAFVLAPRFYKTGEYTISGAIAKKYGNTTRTVVSIISIYALLVVNVSIYVSGAAAISTVVKIPLAVAAIITAAVSAVYVAVGGLKSIAYVNVIHFALKLLTVVIAAAVALNMSGGMEPIRSSLPEYYFTWDGKVGFSTIMAWTVANIGTVFATQQIIQAIAGTKNAGDARKASLIAGILCVPVGILAALVGVAAKYLFPDQNALLALPGFIQHMNPVFGGIVLAGLVAMVFSNSSAVSLAITSLFMKDFWHRGGESNPGKKDRPEDQKKQMSTTRIVSIIICFIPVPFALFFPGLLDTMFFAKALRTSIGVVAVLALCLPFFSTGRGATVGLIGAAIGATVWFLMGNPFGIDNAYVAAVIPLIVMIFDHLATRGGRDRAESRPDANGAAGE